MFLMCNSRPSDVLLMVFYGLPDESCLALLLTAMLIILHMSFALHNETMAMNFVLCCNFSLPIMISS